MEIEILRPLGPLLGKVRLPTDLIEYLNANMSENLKDYSDNLVGKVKQELLFSDEICAYVLDKLGPAFAAYHKQYVSADVGASMDIKATSGWYVRQFAGDYNPIHVHTNGSISCVGYLSLPEGIEKEFEADERDHHPANGRIEFAYGSAAMTYTAPTYMVKPEVGDFYIFPAGLWHMVYPFRTAGERRSFSMNIYVTKTPS